MTPAAFLRKFAGREITAGDVATHLGVEIKVAGQQLAKWNRLGHAFPVKASGADLPTIWRVAPARV